MPTFVAGLPVHPLVVHAVVVLVPLAVLGTIAIAVWPWARRRFGWLAVAVAAVATASIPVATSTGEGLAGHVQHSAQLDRHMQLGGQLLPFAAAMFGAALLFQLLHASGRVGRGMAVRVAAVALAVVTVAGAVASGVQVVRIGDAGARAVWSSGTASTDSR
ncbi:MAG: hypothetical protein J2P24_14330 [Streptosporangiales bacterium]|nr:hypothetical protein [Streptosporangiales bacterium]